MLLYLPYLSAGAGVLGFLPGYLKEEHTDSSGGFWLVAALQHFTGPVACAMPLTRRRHDARGAAALACRSALPGLGGEAAAAVLLFPAFQLLMSPNLPWYFMALLPFVSLLGPAPGWAATICCFVLYDVVRTDNTAVEFAVRDTVLNLAVLTFLAVALWPRRPVLSAAPSEAPRP